MASFRKLPSGKWQVRWRDPDGHPRAKSTTTQKARDLLYLDVTRCEELGQTYESDAREVARPRIDDAMIAFIADLKRSMEPLTVDRYETAVALFGDFLAATDNADITVDALSRDLLAGFYDWLTATKTRSLDTRHRYVENIRRAWLWLYDNEWNKYVPPPRRLSMKRDIEQAVAAPTFEEMAACVRNCVSEGPRRLATILYFTGLRTSQAETLLWDVIDVKRGTMKVAPHKGLPGRIIPLSPHFVAELKTWERTSERVTGWSVTSKVVRQRLSEAWARAEVRSSVWEDAPGKAFRRGLTSGLKQLGADKETAELYVGRAVEGARARYLDLGIVPFLPIANLIPAIEAGVVLKGKFA